MKALLFFENQLIKTIDNHNGGYEIHLPIHEVVGSIDNEDYTKHKPSFIKLVFEMDDRGMKHCIYKFVGYED